MGSLCQIHRIAFDAGLMLQQFPPPYNLVRLQAMARALGFKVGERTVAPPQLTNVTFPCLAILKLATDSAKQDEAHHSAESPATDKPPSSPRSLALVVKIIDDKIVFFEAGKPSAQTIPLAEFSERFEPQALLVTPEVKRLADPDGSSPAKVFGFKWFIPELLKYKTIWRDVLLASLAIQLMALAAPLFTQVVIDKVVVHHTRNTLVVIGIGLAVFMLFTATITWVRQYLVLHTGNRVDAVLGTRVFEHLLRLPPRFFEHRATGVLIARVHGVETIREFVSGAAVSVILDFPFLLIFLAIMLYYSWLLSLIALGLLLVITGLSFAVRSLFRSC